MITRIAACALSATFLAATACPAQSQTATAAPLATPAAPTMPAAQTFTLSAPTVRHLVQSVGPVIASPRLSEPKLFVNLTSLEDQKKAAAANKLGRTSSGTLLFASPSPAPVPRMTPGHGMAPVENLKMVTNTAHLDAATGARTPPGPAAQTMMHQRSVAIDAEFSGNAENLVPPDTQLAVGTSQVVEMDNGSITVYSKTTMPPQAPLGSFALQAQPNGDGGLVAAPQGYLVGDPWITYDAVSHRWIASAMVFQENGSDSWIELAVSQPDDALGDWSVRTLVPSTGNLHDQPKLALTDDKLIVAWTDFDSSGTYVGGSWVAFSKNDVLNSTAALTGQGIPSPDPCQPNPVPAKVQSAGTTAYVLAAVFPDADPHCIGIGVQVPAANTGDDVKLTVIDGVPPSLSYRTVDLQVAPYSAPPDVTQKSSETELSGGDTRLLSAVWQNGKLWAAGNGSCKINGEAAARGCFRLLQIATTGSIRLLSDVNVAIRDRNIFYPSLSMDSAGNVFAAVAQVGPDRYLGAAVFTRIAFHTDWLLLTYAQGNGELVCGTDPTTRIGDYSGADRDPSAPNSVWLAVEVPTAAGCHQGSSIGKVSIH